MLQSDLERSRCSQAELEAERDGVVENAKTMSERAAQQIRTLQADLAHAVRRRLGSNRRVPISEYVEPIHSQADRTPASRTLCICVSLY